MVVIDLRDQSPIRPAEPVWRALIDLRHSQASPGMAVLRRTLLVDALAAGLSVIAFRLMAGPLTAVEGAILLLWPATLAWAGAYRRRSLVRRAVTLRTLVSAFTPVILACTLVAFVVPAMNARYALRFATLLFLLTCVSRVLTSRWVARRRRRGDFLTPVLARGRADDVRALARQLERDRDQPMRVVAVQITDLSAGDERPDVVLVPSRTDPVEAAQRNGAESILIVGSPDLDSDALRRVIWRGERAGIDTLVLPIVEPVAAPQVHWVTQGSLSSLSFAGPNRRLFVLKLAMDQVAATIGLLVLTPALFGIAALIKLNSPGPVLFRQARVGMDGRQFTMLKFRTMTTDAEALRADLEERNAHAGGTLFKIKDDPRVTTVGRVLRRYSLDELPQLINVVRGEMSLVGPRPPLPTEVQKYPLDSMRRFIVRPGLTGLWQVSGRSDLDPIDSARLDTQYVEHWSLGMDLRILIRTAKVVLTGHGAY